MKQSKIDKFAMSVLPRKWFELGIDVRDFDYTRIVESGEAFSNKNVKKAKVCFAIALIASIYGMHCWNSAVAADGAVMMAEHRHDYDKELMKTVVAFAKTANREGGN